MTITLGFWIVPAAITIIAVIVAAAYRPSGDYDMGGPLLGLLGAWVAGAAWLMWLLSWFF